MINHGYNELIEWTLKQPYYVQFLLEKLLLFGTIKDSEYHELIDNYIKGKITNIHYNEVVSTNDNLIIKKIINVNGVNKLSSNESLELGEGLTILYGDNGSGKTGYARIFKSLGLSFEKNNFDILSDINKPPKTAEADVHFLLNGEEKIIHWKHTDSPKLNIKVFDNNSTKICLGKKRDFIARPNILVICEKLGEAIKKFSEIAKNKMECYAYDILNIHGIKEGTKIHSLLYSFSSEKSYPDFEDKLLENIDGYDIDKVNEMVQELETQLKSLKIEMLFQEWNKCNKYNEKITQFVNKLVLGENPIYGNNWWNELMESCKKRKILIAESAYMDNILKDMDISIEFKSTLINMVLSLSEYSKSINKKDLKDVEFCVVCGQELVTMNSKKKYRDYYKLIEKDSTFKIDNLTMLIAEKYKQLEILKRDIKNICEESKMIITDNRLEIYKNIIIEILNDRLENVEIYCNYDLDDKIKQIKDLENEYEELAKSKKASLSKLDADKENLENKKKECESILCILKNKQIIIDNAKKYFLLKFVKSINVSSLSKCQSTIIKKYYSDQYETLVNDYFKKLKVPDNIKFSTKIADSKLSLEQKCINEEINNVFSEGEKTVTALGEFLAECEIFDKKSIIVFDDVVNSLDLKRIRYVAREIVDLAETRQVIVLTHNLIFYASLGDLVSNTKVLAECYRVTSNGLGEFGCLFKDIMPSKNMLKDKMKEINVRLSSSKKDFPISEVKYLYGILRECTKLLICEKILKNSVRRYEKNVSVDTFIKLNFDKIKDSLKKINDIYVETCRYLPGHSDPMEDSLDPNINDFKGSVKEVQDLIKIFNN